METETKPLWTTTREAMGKTWTVGLCADDLSMMKGGSNLGRSRYVKQALNVNANMPPETRDETLLHELVHLAGYLTGNELPENSVIRITNTLYAFLRGFGLWQPFPWPDEEEATDEDQSS